MESTAAATFQLAPEEVAFLRVRMAMLESTQRELGIEELRHAQARAEIIARSLKAEQAVTQALQMVIEKNVPLEARNQHYDFDVRTGVLTRMEKQNP